MTHTDRDAEAQPSGDAGGSPVPGRHEPAGTRSGPATRATLRPADEPVYETGAAGLVAVLAGIVAVGVLFGWAWPVIILGFGVVIFLHELGHFVTAKWSGMKATEFFIGFGPRIWSFRRGETEYGLKAVPAGAYVKIIGMNNLDEVDPADEPRTYRQQSFPKRLLVVSAGSMMHMLQAFVLLVILLGVVGVPGGSLTDDAARARNWEVGSVVEGSAADGAGLREGDRIVSINGDRVSTWSDVTDVIRASEVGDEVVLGIERGGSPLTLDAELRPRPRDQGGDEGSPFLGVGATASREAIGLGSALVKAPGEMVSFAGDAVGAMAGFFSPSGLGDFADTVGRADDPSAPSSGSGDGSQATSDDGDDNRVISIYGAIRMAVQLSEDGWMWVLLMFFQVNIFIGILNMAPLPPLDGGHAAVAIYERVRSRAGRRYHADMAKLLPLTYAVIMGLLVLGVASLYLDIVNPIDV
ncbi:MAG TPA: site-2 protease family protein [Acidimicrobiales bacterium]|nr:site-2 protease family protein [Acidimicrobiales bacterium]